MMDPQPNQTDKPTRTGKLLNYIIILSLFSFALAWWNKNSLPNADDLLPNLHQNPLQTETTKLPFLLSYGAKTITVKPLAQYEMWALVTSLSDSNFFLTDHKANDINVRDVCVIWGTNLTPELLSHISTQNGEFSCQFNVASPEQYYKFFDIKAATNDHLLTNQEKFRKLINNLHIGDQIYIKGQLVSYHQSGWGDSWRTSGLVNGTKDCKVIYLEDVQILASGNPGWNRLYQLSKWMIIISLLLRFIVFMREPI